MVLICENGGRNAFETLVRALRRETATRVAAETAPESEAIVRLVRLQLSRLIDVWIAEANQNLGYAGGINAWLRMAADEPGWTGAWILNPDAAPERGALVALLNCARTRNKGMVGSRVMLNETPDRIASRGLRWRRLAARCLGVDRAAPATRPDPDDVEARIDAPHGGSFYVTRGCIEAIGLMDERYFLYFEDLEWGLRAKAKVGLGYAFDSIVPHIGGTTTGSSPTRALRSPLVAYLTARNSLHFVRAHYPRWFLWTVLMNLLRTLEYLAVGQPHNFWVAVLGVIAGLRNEIGRPDWLLRDLAPASLGEGRAAYEYEKT